MVTIYKLVQKFLDEPNKITITDIERLMEAFGYKERRKRGSERIFHKKGSNPINVPTVSGRSIKIVYVKRIVKILNLEEWIERNKER